EYRRHFSEKRSTDYKKLFPDGEPEWDLPAKGQVEPRDAGQVHNKQEMPDAIRELLAPVERALLDRQQSINDLNEETKKLKADLSSIQAAFHDVRDRPQRAIADDELRADCERLLKNKDNYIHAIRSACVV